MYISEIWFQKEQDNCKFDIPKTEEEYQKLLEEIASLGEIYDTVKEV